MSKIKLERIASSILRELSSIIYEEVHNEIIKSVTITEVRVTNDLSMCKVFYTFYGDYEKQEVQAELTNASSFLRTEESTEYGEHIDEIIEEIHAEANE